MLLRNKILGVGVSAVFAAAVVLLRPGTPPLAFDPNAFSGPDEKIPGVIFTGSPGRDLAVLKLYDEGKISRLLITSIDEPQSLEQLIASTGFHPKRSLSDITVDHLANDTAENADIAATWLKQQYANAVVLITSECHMGRATYLLEKRVKNLKIYGVTVPNSSFDICGDELIKMAATRFGIEHVGNHRRIGSIIARIMPFNKNSPSPLAATFD